MKMNLFSRNNNYNKNIIYYDESLKKSVENNNNCAYFKLKLKGTFYGVNNFQLFKEEYNYLDSVKKEKGILAKKRIEDEYTWECILSKYEKNNSTHPHHDSMDGGMEPTSDGLVLAGRCEDCVSDTRGRGAGGAGAGNGRRRKDAAAVRCAGRRGREPALLAGTLRCPVAARRPGTQRVHDRLRIRRD